MYVISVCGKYNRLRKLGCVITYLAELTNFQKKLRKNLETTYEKNFERLVLVCGSQKSYKKVTNSYKKVTTFF